MADVKDEPTVCRAMKGLIYQETPVQKGWSRRSRQHSDNLDIPPGIQL